MGKSSINGPLSMAMLNNQRVITMLFFDNAKYPVSSGKEHVVHTLFGCIEVEYDFRHQYTRNVIIFSDAHSTRSIIVIL